jgi:heme A synthase
MLGLIFNIANITGGVLLGIALLDQWDGEKDFFNKIAKALAPFQTIIGGALVVLSLLFLLKGAGLLYNLTSLVGGFLLLTPVISKAPAFQKTLYQLEAKLMPFKAGIGVALIVIGILRIF